MRRLALVVACGMSLSGCYLYSNWQLQLAERDVLAQQAKLLALYQACLTEFRGRPIEARRNCEHYTQALHSLDVRMR